MRPQGRLGSRISGCEPGASTSPMTSTRSRHGRRMGLRPGNVQLEVVLPPLSSYSGNECVSLLECQFRWSAAERCAADDVLQQKPAKELHGLVVSNLELAVSTTNQPTIVYSPPTVMFLICFSSPSRLQSPGVWLGGNSFMLIRNLLATTCIGPST